MQVLNQEKSPEADFSVKIVCVSLNGIWHNDASNGGGRGFRGARTASKEGS